MPEPERPRTRLEQLLRQRHWSVDELRRRFAQTSGTELSERQAYRWLGGALRSLPYPHACSALEKLFGEPVGRLLGPAYGINVPARRRSAAAVQDGDWHGPVLAASAERARDFLTQMEVTNVGSETLEQLGHDVRRLVVDYQIEPLDTLLAEVVDTQSRAFSLLEGRQPPEQARELYLLAGIASGLMAKASHDLGASHEALTQSRAAYACADNAGHDGLRAWTRGLQSQITYWAGRFAESVRFAQRGAEVATHVRGTSSIWLAVSEARALAALGRLNDARSAVDRATEAREHATGDDLDELGGLCTFLRPRQLYYEADALAWGGAAEAVRAEAAASEALDLYQTASSEDQAFGDRAGARCVLAVARIARNEIDGAAEVTGPVLDLPPEKRIQGVVGSVQNVQRALTAVETAKAGAELVDRIHDFSHERLVITR